jgi:hypothetical protein
VSIVDHWTVFSRLFALICSEIVRLGASRMSRVSAPFSWRMPGPMIVFRAASPKTPGAVR